MSDKVDKGEELGDRFSTRSRPKGDQEDDDDVTDEGDTEDTQHTENTDTVDNTGGTGHTSGSSDQGDTGDTGHTPDSDDQGDTPQADSIGDEGTTRNRSQYVFYLPQNLQEELDRLYDQYNGQSLIEGEGGIEKHKDFLEGLVRAGLNNPDLDDYIGVKREQ